MLVDVFMMVEHPIMAENTGERPCNRRVIPQLRKWHSIAQRLAAEALRLPLAELLQDARVVALRQRRLDDMIPTDDEVLQTLVAEAPAKGQGHHWQEASLECDRITDALVGPAEWWTSRAMRGEVPAGQSSEPTRKNHAPCTATGVQCPAAGGRRACRPSQARTIGPDARTASTTGPSTDVTICHRRPHAGLLHPAPEHHAQHCLTACKRARS